MQVPPQRLPPRPEGQGFRRHSAVTALAISEFLRTHAVLNQIKEAYDAQREGWDNEPGELYVDCLSKALAAVLTDVTVMA